jgi:hypothetical protein
MPNHLYHDPYPLPIVERHPSAGTLATHEEQEGGASRVHLRIVSIRKRLLDPDNLSVKWLIDCLRYSSIIRGDEPDKITLQVEQRKCAKGEAEATQIFITFPPKA